MKKATKKLCAIAISSVLAVGTMGALAGCGKDDPNTFTIWMGSSVNSEFFSDYGENPAMQYLEEKFDIKLEFQTPLVGNEKDDFSKLIGSGDYPDMMDITFYTGVLADLYDGGHGAALDLTQYIADYMPNYSKFLTDNAEITKYAKVDGKYLTLNNYNETIPDQWGGWMYRRDWLVKYDGNPDVADADGNYKDGVHFPDGYLDENGYDNPLTIADWEYMLDLFKKNVSGLKYGITLPSQGYHDTGDLASAFGGGGLWNLVEGDTKGSYDKVEFGGTSDNFRRYTETMNKWYKNGWLDPSFTSNSGQMFYALDGGSITSGKVGIWYGTRGHLGDLMKESATADMPMLEGVDVWGARQPKETVDSPDPTVFYLDGQETTRRWIITDRAKNKNLDKLFAMLDYLYSDEGAAIKGFGLTKEQWDEYSISKSLMNKYHLTEGAYWWADANGNKVAAGTEGAKIRTCDEILNSSGDLLVSVCGQYFFGKGLKTDLVLPLAKNEHQNFINQTAYREWGWYNDYGTIKESLKSQMTSEEGKSYNTIQQTIITQIAIELPKLITNSNGVSNSAWNSYCGSLRTRKCDNNTSALQVVIDRVK